MKTVLVSAAILVATAASAFALSTPDVDRFGVNVEASALTPAQATAIEQAVHSGNSNGEIKALIKSIVNNG